MNLTCTHTNAQPHEDSLLGKLKLVPNPKKYTNFAVSRNETTVVSLACIVRACVCVCVIVSVCVFVVLLAVCVSCVCTYYRC